MKNESVSRNVMTVLSMILLFLLFFVFTFFLGGEIKRKSGESFFSLLPHTCEQICKRQALTRGVVAELRRHLAQLEQDVLHRRQLHLLPRLLHNLALLAIRDNLLRCPALRRVATVHDKPARRCHNRLGEALGDVARRRQDALHLDEAADIACERIVAVDVLALQVGQHTALHGAVDAGLVEKLGVVGQLLPQSALRRRHVAVRACVQRQTVAVGVVGGLGVAARTIEAVQDKLPRHIVLALRAAQPRVRDAVLARADADVAATGPLDGDRRVEVVGQHINVLAARRAEAGYDQVFGALVAHIRADVVRARDEAPVPVRGPVATLAVVAVHGMCDLLVEPEDVGDHVHGAALHVVEQTGDGPVHLVLEVPTRVDGKFRALREDFLGVERTVR
eukprot:PhM_4_TR3217/c0_g1_i1/m.102211